MSTEQPKWKLVVQLGDVNPIDYGGYFVYEDETGVYEPEAELLDSAETDDGTWIVHRFSLDRCKMVESFLVPHKYNASWPHPANRYDEWFNRDLDQVSVHCGIPVETLRAQLCAESAIERAQAYRAIGEHHGFENLDSDPLTFTDRAEVEARYANPKRPWSYEVIVGNIGTIYDGHDETEARRIYAVYLAQSQANYGRAAGESVTLMQNGEPLQEYQSTGETE